MAGYLVTNGQPRGYPLGIKDESRGRDILTPITRPQFFPLFFILAQRTFDDAFTLNGASSELLGPETFNKDSVYYTHANAYVKSLLKKANQMIVETVKLPGATKAVLRFSVEVIPTDLDVYTRVSDENFGIVGDVTVDALGARSCRCCPQAGACGGTRRRSVHHVQSRADQQAGRDCPHPA